MICLFTILMQGVNVNAKDTLYSIGKYKEEELSYLEKSYNSKNEKDGFVVAGKYLSSKDKSTKKYQATLIKYNYQGEVVWEYKFENAPEINALTYTYSVENTIDGYLVMAKEKLNEEENEKNKIFKISLKGELVWEKEVNLSQDATMIRVLPVIKENNEFSNYIGIANSSEKAYLVAYSKEGELLWSKEQDANFLYKDLIVISDNEKDLGYVAILENKETSQLIKYNLTGDVSKVLNSNLGKIDSNYLTSEKNGFILYGKTDEVKVKSGSVSYYLKKYDNEGIEKWETVGNTAIREENKIKLISSLNKNDEITGYLLLYINNEDNSLEVVKISSDGLIGKKIKKIINDYYFINDFQMKNNTLYFTGYITCPEDDDCGYDTHSLFLISDEDKVIEVKEDDNQKILIVGVAFILLIMATVIIRKKKKKLTNN